MEFDLASKVYSPISEERGGTDTDRSLLPFRQPFLLSKSLTGACLFKCCDEPSNYVTPRVNDVLRAVWCCFGRGGEGDDKARSFNKFYC